MLKPVRCLFVPVIIWSALPLARADLITENLNASLDSGSLTGIMFPVTFSYDSSEVNPVGESFVALESFDFVLLGVPFTLNDIFQGGQAIFEDSVIENVTASFQVIFCRRTRRSITLRLASVGRVLLAILISTTSLEAGRLRLLPLCRNRVCFRYSQRWLDFSSRPSGSGGRPLMKGGGTNRQRANRSRIASIVATEMRSPSKVNSQTPVGSSPGAERNCFQPRRLHANCDICGMRARITHLPLNHLGRYCENCCPVCLQQKKQEYLPIIPKHTGYSP